VVNFWEVLDLHLNTVVNGSAVVIQVSPPEPAEFPLGKITSRKFLFLQIVSYICSVIREEP
jgi:hypothetical protein